ncbi:MAG: type VI secretion system protein TssR domain-containing protein [Flavobacteriales bacterium]
MKRILMLMVAMQFVIGALQAQKYTVAYPPINYFFYPDGRLVGNVPVGERQTNANNTWVVWSDRAANPTYEDKECTKEKGKLNFLQTCYVVDETEDAIHVVQYDLSQYNSDTRKLSATVADYGWVKKDKMLLWKKGLVTEKNNFRKKALATHSIESLKNPSKYVFENSTIIRIFGNPQLTKKLDVNVQLFGFLFIYKETDDAALVGRDYDFTDNDAGGILLGWVSKKILAIWEQRLCLEPNWDDAAATERRDKNIQASIFKSQEDAEAFQSNCKNIGLSQNYGFKDTYTDRQNMNWLRSPVLDRKTVDGVTYFETGFVSEIKDLKGKTVMSKEEHAHVRDEANRVSAETRKINIVFVVDGSRYMNNWFPAIYEGIAKSIDNFESEETTENTFQWGAVVYRDYVEEKCEDGNIAYEAKKLAGNGERIKEFFRNDALARNCMDKEDGPQAVRLGLQKALEMFEGKGDQTNIIVLIGGPGNDKKDKRIAEEDLIKLIKATRATIVTYQVSKNDHVAYQDMINQSQSLMVKGGEAIRSEYKDDYPGRTKKVQLKETDDLFEFRLNYPQESPVYGAVHFTEMGKSVEPDTLKQFIVETVIEVDTLTSKGVNRFETKISGIGEREDSSEALLLMLSKMENIPIDTLRILADNSFQFFINGFATDKCIELEHPVYKYVLFIDDEEFTRLITAIEEISQENSTNNETRDILDNAFRNIVKTYYGNGKEASGAFDKLSSQEVINLITGLPVGSKESILSKYKADQFKVKSGKDKIPDDEVQKVAAYLLQKESELKKIKRSKEHSFEISNTRYYWLPIDALP